MFLDNYFSLVIDLRPVLKFIPGLKSVGGACYGPLRIARLAHAVIRRTCKICNHKHLQSVT